MKMDQNGHDFAWAKLALTFSSLTCCKLTGFELRGKADQKTIDSTKQLEYTHF
jgi:hypothetical protein